MKNDYPLRDKTDIKIIRTGFDLSKIPKADERPYELTEYVLLKDLLHNQDSDTLVS
jgi:hypothetical protein